MCSAVLPLTLLLTVRHASLACYHRRYFVPDHKLTSTRKLQVFLSSSIYSKACLTIDEMLPGGIMESLDPDAILNAVKLQKANTAVLPGSSKGR